MPTTRSVTIEEVHSAARALAGRWNSHPTKLAAVYGIPRGGLVPAGIVASELGLPLTSDPRPQADTLVVDDLVDSGATVAPYMEAGTPVDALYRKTWAPLTSPATVDGDPWLIFPWEATSTTGGPTDAVTRLLEWVGEDPTRPGLIDTPARVVKAWAEMTAGYAQDPAAILARQFPDRCDEMVLVTGIDFVSLCEHHILPFTGRAAVGYLPGEQVVGLSKIPRLVHAFAQRLQVQERLTEQVALALNEHLQPDGVGVIITAHHSCMSCRGVRLAGASMTTSALLGKFREDPRARSEFLTLATRTP